MNAPKLVSTQGFAIRMGCGVAIQFTCQDCKTKFDEFLSDDAILSHTATEIRFDHHKLRSNTHCKKCEAEQLDAAEIQCPVTTTIG